MTSTARETIAATEERRRALAGELRNHRARLEKAREDGPIRALDERLVRAKAAHEKAVRAIEDDREKILVVERMSSSAIFRLERELRELAPAGFAEHEWAVRSETNRAFNPRSLEEHAVAIGYLDAARAALARIDALLWLALSDQEIVDQAAAIAAELREKRAQL